MDALLMNAALAVSVLAIKLLVFTNSPKIAPLIVLIVRELMTASFRARERSLRELTLIEEAEVFITLSSFALKELTKT
jgi:hypothetical protein